MGSSQDEADEDAEVERELNRVDDEDQGTSSSDDSSSDDQDLDEEDEVFGLLDDQEGQDGIPKGEVSSRIAVVNLDWDNIRATDLLAVFSSFAPASGKIRKISIYPSQYGKERMEREELDGPPKEIFGSEQDREAIEDHSDESDVDDREEHEEGDDNSEDEKEKIKAQLLGEDQGLEFNAPKLRRYQLERLRYYYAVLNCSSTATAQAIYDAVDGTEYLTTANFFDLRYIPDEVDFTEDQPRDECESIPDGYRPNEFVTDALQHSKVRLTWDADDGFRKEAQKRAFTGSRADIDENDLQAYLGSDSSEDDGLEPIVVDATADTPGHVVGAESKEADTGPKVSKKEAERQRMRAILGLQPEPMKKRKEGKDAPVGDMQVTFSSGLSSEAKKGSVFENEPPRDETTAEKYIRREKERKARRKEKARSLRNGAEAVAGNTSENANVEDDSDVETKPTPDPGFSDPFFDNPSHDKITTAAQRKASKRQKREERAADEAAASSKRAELELMMLDDKETSATNNIKHFDINDIAKAEKALSKRKKSSKKQKLSEREEQALEAKKNDQFEINVDDERFRDVFAKSDFAIDPSHPRFKGTQGMNTLLEEGRRKRKVDDDEDDYVGGRGVKQGKKTNDVIDDKGEQGELKRLVHKIKGKSAKKGKQKQDGG